MKGRTGLLETKGA